MGSRSLRFPSFSNFAKDFSCSFISSSSASEAVFISSRFFGGASLSVVLPRFKTSPTPVLLDLLISSCFVFSGGVDLGTLLGFAAAFLQAGLLGAGADAFVTTSGPFPWTFEPLAKIVDLELLFGEGVTELGLGVAVGVPEPVEPSTTCGDSCICRSFFRAAFSDFLISNCESAVSSKVRELEDLPLSPGQQQDS